MTSGKNTFLFAALALIAGCTGSTNPETATVFDNINNLNSGEYDRQIAANKSQADAILANNAAAENRIASLENQRAANSRQLAALRSEVASARSAAASARSRVSGDSAKLTKLNALETQLTTVSAEVNNGTANPSIARAELRRIRTAIGAL